MLWTFLEADGSRQMSGQIFISYRREDSSAWAGRLSDRLSSHFPSNQIFMDVDTIEPGMDFVEAIEESVGSCDVLIAVIGTRWLNSSNPAGKRRLEIPEDSVRVEVSTALKRGIRVIPVLVEGATMPEAADLPDELMALVRRNALKLSHDRFRAESELLASTVGRVLENAEARRREQEERERLETERRETEEKERREAERRQKEQEKLRAEQRQRGDPQRISESHGREQREREADVRERQEAEQPDARLGESEEQARIKAGVSPCESEGRERREEEAASAILKPSFSREDASSPQGVGTAIAPRRSPAKTKWLLVVSLPVALIAGIGVVVLTGHRKPAVALVSPTPTTIPTPRPITVVAGTPISPTPTQSFDVVTASSKIEVGQAVWYSNQGHYELYGTVDGLYSDNKTVSLRRDDRTRRIISYDEFFKSGTYFVRKDARQ
jgi:TIR domain